MIVFLDTGIGFGLAREISSVGYICMNTSAYPKNDALIGTGYNNVTVALTEYGLNKLIKDADKVVYLDNGIKYAPEEGWICSGRMEVLEFNREKGKEALQNVGVKVVNYEVANGVAEIVKILNKRSWKAVVKVNSYFRKSVETKVITNITEGIEYINAIKDAFGIYSSAMKFQVEDVIEGNIEEWGVDLLVENGKVKSPWLYGIENGEGYVSIVTSNKAQDLVSRLESIFDEYQYNGVVAVETLIDKDSNEAYITEMNCRFGYPFSLIYPRVVSNWEELLLGWNDGVMPKFIAKVVGARIEETSKNNWEELTSKGENFVPRRSMMLEGVEYHIPGEDEVIGVTVGYGSTADEVVKMIGEGTWTKGLVEAFKSEKVVNEETQEK